MIACGPAQAGGLLRDVDRALAAQGPGETTLVLAVVRAGEVFGASVGDSAAWLIEGDGHLDLTHAQARKPLLGSGCAWPVGFGPGPFPLSARLLLASDGLVKYASPERLCVTARGIPAGRAAQSLIECVRLPAGHLPDDVSVILCERG